MSDIFPGVGTGPNAQLGLGNRAQTSPFSIRWDRDDPAHGRPRVRSPSLGPTAAPARLSKGGHVRFSGSAGTGLRTLTPRTPPQVVLALSREAPASLSWGLRGHISHLLCRSPPCGGHADPAGWRGALTSRPPIPLGGGKRLTDCGRQGPASATQ